MKCEVPKSVIRQTSTDDDELATGQPRRHGRVRGNADADEVADEVNDGDDHDVGNADADYGEQLLIVTADSSFSNEVDWIDGSAASQLQATPSSLPTSQPPSPSLSLSQSSPQSFLRRRGPPPPRPRNPRGDVVFEVNGKSERFGSHNDMSGGPSSVGGVESQIGARSC
eukprot:6196707-Pleurochrysis_carterae.AAC.2